GSFPPKDLLPAAALAEHRSALGKSGAAPPDGTTPAERVITLLRAPTAALTNAPRLAAAMLQAMASGEPDVAPLLASLTEPLVAETAHAIRPENPTPADHELARTIQRVWFAAVVGWVSAAETADSINHAVETAAHQLLDHASTGLESLPLPLLALRAPSPKRSASCAHIARLAARARSRSVRRSLGDVERASAFWRIEISSRRV